MQESSVISEARAQVQANEAPAIKKKSGAIRMSLSQLEASRWHRRYDFEWEQPTAVQLLRELSDTLSSSFPPITFGRKGGGGGPDFSPAAASRRSMPRASWASPMATRESPPSSLIVSTQDGRRFTYTKPVHGMEMWCPVQREKTSAEEPEHAQPLIQEPPSDQIPREPLKKAPRKREKKKRDPSNNASDDDIKQPMPNPAVYLPRIMSKLEETEQDVLEAEAKQQLLCRRFAPSRRARRGRAVVTSLESPFPEIS